MAGKPQTLSQGQQAEVARIVQSKVLKWILASLGVISSITGVGVWQVMTHIQKKMEARVAAQFDEPRIRATVESVASTKAAGAITREIQPEVDRFKAEVNQKLANLQSLVAEAEELERNSQVHEGTIRSIMSRLQQVLQDSQATRDEIVGLKSDIVRVQKCEARIQYYTLKGRSQFPNPYHQQVIEALNEMLAIAVPDAVDRRRFIDEMGGPSL